MLWFLLIGLIAGWLAGQVTKGGGFGFWGNLLIGVLGSYVGSWVFGLLNLNAYGMIGQVVTATIGAIVFLWIWQKLTPSKN